MKKSKFILLLIPIAGIIILACNKINKSINEGQIQNGQNDISYSKVLTSDSYLISVIQNTQMNQYEKARILLNEDLLSTTVCNELLSNSANYDQYIIEVVLASQIELKDEALINLIEKVGINDATVKSILQSKSPLSNTVKSKLTSTRPNINTTDIVQYDNYIKLINMCDQSILYTESLIYSKGSDRSNFLTKNLQSKKFINTTNDSNIAMMISGCGGRWTCGSARVRDEGNGITSIQCINTSEKCVKIAKEKKSLSTFDNGIVSVLDDPNLNSFEKTNSILNIENISPELMNEIIDRRTSLNSHSFEIILLSSGKISDSNLAKMIIDPTINESLLRNILIVNTPLSEDSKDLISRFHPSISLSGIANYNNKSLAISLCLGGLLSGDNISINEVSDTNHEISVTNQTIIPFVFSASDPDVATMIAGCGGKWICGEYVYKTKFDTTVTHACSAPPNKKCVKVAKTN